MSLKCVALYDTALRYFHIKLKLGSQEGVRVGGLQCRYRRFEGLIRWCSWISVVISAAFVAWGVIAADNLAAVAGAILDFVIADLGWVFILSSFGFLAFSVYLALSRYGNIRLWAGRTSDRSFAPARRSL